MLLPQRPYVTSGSLREQLTYPLTPNDAEVSDEHLVELLRFVHLGHLVEETQTAARANIMSRRFDENDEAARLEQQRIPLASADPARYADRTATTSAGSVGLRRRSGSAGGRESLLSPSEREISAADGLESAYTTALSACEPWGDVLSVGEFVRSVWMCPLLPCSRHICYRRNATAGIHPIVRRAPGRCDHG